VCADRPSAPRLIKAAVLFFSFIIRSAKHITQRPSNYLEKTKYV